jgi:hypothetical protein
MRTIAGRLGKRANARCFARLSVYGEAHPAPPRSKCADRGTPAHCQPSEGFQDHDFVGAPDEFAAGAYMGSGEIWVRM